MFTKYAKPVVLLIGICLLFFYKTLIFGKIPFPGDLLLSQYAPWRHVSYDGYVAGAVPSKDQYFDVLRELYPWKTQAVNSLKKGEFPLWNPYNGSGTPLLANYQSQVLYPLSILYFLTPQLPAWTVMVIIQPVLGSIFVYLFATEIGLTSAAAILSAILFNFGSFANVWMEFTTVWHTILWLPLLLFLVEKNVKQKGLTLSQQILFIFALFSAITGGHPQDFINLFIFLLIYITARKSFSLLFLLIIPFFLAAAQLFPTIELFLHSARISHEYTTVVEKMLIQWWQLPLIVIQDFFGNPATRTSITGDYVGKTLSIGIAGFVLAATAVILRKKSWHAKFFVWTTIVILLLTVHSPLTELYYQYPMPILSTGTPTRILFLLNFALAILAGFGFQKISRKKNLLLPFIITWMVILCLWFFAPLQRPMILTTAILLGISVIVILSRYRSLIRYAIIPLVTFELFYSFNKFNPFVPKSFVFPKNELTEFLRDTTGINRFWGYGTAEIQANFATQEHLFSPDNTDPLNLRWYNQLVQASHDGNLALTFNRSSRSDAQLAPGYGERDLPDNIFRLRLMDMIGVKYIIDRSENPKGALTFSKDRFKEIWHKEDWTVYENIKAAPRFFLTSDVRSYKDIPDFEHQVFSSEFKPHQTVLISEADWHTLPELPKLELNNTATLVSYTPNRVEFRTVSDIPALLYLSDTYDTGWRAMVNGKTQPVVRANYAFRGVAVPKGQSTVVFSYAPRSFEVGKVISILSFLSLIGYCVYYKSRKNQNIIQSS